MHHLGPSKERAASSVRGVVPSWLTRTSSSASARGARTSSRACTAEPPVCAAWKDVPHPVSSTRASGKRRSVDTCASQSGCAWIPSLVKSPPGIGSDDTWRVSHLYLVRHAEVLLRGDQ